MLKEFERSEPNSCWNKAEQYEPVFVLIGRDKAAPATIRFWIKMRINLGKNQPGDPQLVEAEDLANVIEDQLNH